MKTFQMTVRNTEVTEVVMDMKVPEGKTQEQVIQEWQGLIVPGEIKVLVEDVHEISTQVIKIGELT